MSIQFRCVSCNKKLNVHDRFANRMLKCPACQSQQRVPERTTLDALRNPETDPSMLQSESHVVTKESLTESSNSVDASTQNASEVQRENDNTHEGRQGHGSRKHREKSHGGEEEDLEWDITPMVDVAFLLLIFFMLTASFSIQKAIPTSAEEKEHPSRNSIQRDRSDQPDSFVIQIDEYNAYTVISNDGGTMDATSKQELIVVLEDLKSQLGDVSPRVILQAHSLSLHGAVVACMDAAREAGFDSFQMQSVDEFD